MKRKKMVRVIEEAGKLMDTLGSVAAIDKDGEHEDIDSLVSVDEIHAMQTALWVVKDLITGNSDGKYENGIALAVKIIGLHGLMKLDDILDLDEDEEEGQESTDD